jgi:hypothetical protein
MRHRYKALVIGSTAVALCGAASLAHANFGNGELGRKAQPEAGVSTWSELNLKAQATQADASSERYAWPTVKPTAPAPTKPTSTKPAPSTPTTTKPAPSTPSSSAQTTATPPTGGTAKGDWPGHIPGQFYLGMACDDNCAVRGKALGADYTVHRTFKGWGNWNGVAKEIAADHAAGRLPWVSVKPPQRAVAGWKQVSSGAVDKDIKALATVLKANDDKPVLLTFNHEPSNDAGESEGKTWAAAYAHFHDVLKAEGALKNVADPPILGEWLFNTKNKSQDPANWALPSVLSRAPFMGVDLYQGAAGPTMADRLPVVLDWLDKAGYPDMMVGIGEMGATDKYKNTTAAKWINESLAWVAAHTDRIGVVSYFNSKLNSKPNVYWPLDESASKMAAYRSWLTSNKVARLR